MTLSRRIVLATTFLSIAMVRFPILFVEAESDSFNVQRSSGYAGDEPENAIIKWCSDRDSSRVRYASANIDLAGWSPCGEVKTLAYCDASGGRRYLLPDAEVPYGYRPCSEGSRIYVKLHDKVMYFDDGKGSILGVDEYTERLGSVDNILEAKDFSEAGLGYQDAEYQNPEYQSSANQDVGLSSQPSDSTEELVNSVKNLGQLASNYVDLPSEASLPSKLPSGTRLPGGSAESKKKPAGQGMFDKLQTMLRDILPK